MAKDSVPTNITLESLPELLKHDSKVKVAGVDIDGLLRGKLISKRKFLSMAKDGFGFCSVLFAWDMEDKLYFKELKISNAENGYRDVIAVPDLHSFRRIPWEDDVPFFLVSFFDPDTRKPVSACPRGLLKTAVEKWGKDGLSAMAGGEHSPLSISYDSPFSGLNIVRIISRVRVPSIQNASQPNCPDVRAQLIFNC